ncbi:hypothetical protein AB205_0180980, partial [Aquarana catesbeiana]
MTGAAEKIKEILGNFKNLQFFTGESMDPEGMVGFLDYREDGITPFMTFFLDGLELEKYDEMFSDIYPTKEVCNGLCIEVEGKTITRREGDIDDALIGGNASAEALDEGGDGVSVSGVDIVMNHKLQETGFTKDAFKRYIKDYMK